MAWSDRQLAMLREIGVSAWLPRAEDGPAAIDAVGPSASTQAAQAAEAAQGSAPPPAPGTRPMATPAVAPPSTAAEAASDYATAPAAAAWPTEGGNSGRIAPLAPPTSSTGVDVAHLGWDELRAAVAACQACSLCQTRRQTVFGVGHPAAHWMIVGEAPGEQEDLRGEPFVGAAGQLLDRMLASLGLTRDDPGQGVEPAQQVYIANTLKCRPPRNRNPEPAELARCEPFLIRQIELLRPRIILAMGRFAVQALLRTDEAIGRLRGRVHRYQGVPLVVTYHPAYLLRNPVDKAKAWDDLCLAASILDALPHG